MIFSFVPRMNIAERSEKITFHFPNKSQVKGNYFTEVLYRFLSKRQKEVKDVVLVGEKASKWELLLNFCENETYKNSLKQLLSKFKNVLEKDSELKKTIAEIEELLSRATGSRFKLIVLDNLETINDAKKNEDFQKTLISEILRTLSVNIDEIYFDTTYTQGSIPLLTFGILMPTRYVSVKKLRVIYANTNSVENLKPVFEMEIIEQIIDFDEAIANFEQNGDFARPLRYFMPKKSETIKEIYKQFELNHVPREAMEGLKKIIPSGQIYFLEKVKDELLAISNVQSVEELFYQKAKFYFVRGQYFKAIPLIFEAIVTAATVILYGRGAEFDKRMRNKAKDKMHSVVHGDDYQTFEKLRTLRNRVIHGIVETDYITFPSDEELKELFEKSSIIFEKLNIRIKNGDIGILKNETKVYEDFWI